MAQSYVEYAGNGSTTDFTFPFLYLDGGHIAVLVNGQEVSFTFITANSVRLTAAPGPGTTVRIERKTDRTAAPVDFVDGSTLLEQDLDALAQWSLYVAQEIEDRSTERLDDQQVQLDDALEVAAGYAAAAKQSADSIAGLSPVNLTPYMLDVLANTTAAGARGDLGVTSTADLSDGSDPAKADALMAVKQPLTSAVVRTQHDKNADFVSVLDLGLVNNGVTANDAALVAAETEAAAKGFHLYWPRGSYRFTGVIDKRPGVMWRGTGRRKAYPGVFVPGVNTLSTIVADHTGRTAIRIFSNTLDAGSGFMIQDLNFATLGTAGSVGPTAAVGFECGAFQRDFTFERCGFHGFTSAFDVYKTGGVNIEMGVIKILNCSISLNKWIARTLDGTQWNSFVFLFNEAGQNGYDVGGGGIDVAAYSAAIDYNLLEGQRDAVKIRGSYRGLSVRSNYFEANVGRACIELKDVRGNWRIGENNYSNVNYAALDQLVILGSACGQGQCNEPYFPELVYKTKPAVIGADAGTGDNSLNPTTNLFFGRVDELAGSNYACTPQLIDLLRQRVTISQRERNPQTGEAMPVQEYTTAGAGAVSLSYGIPALSGRWLVVSWLVKLVPDGSAAPDPYLSLNINGTSASGSHDFAMTRFGTYFNAGEWALITVATRAMVAVTSLTVDLYPHGIAPAAGRVSRFLRPVVFSVDHPNKIHPLIDNFIAQSATAAPTVGTWQTGDFIRAATPAAGQLGYACSVGGTPGTWVNV